MEILILGNGFDLEHNLPTQYRDFLVFVKEYIQIALNENWENEIGRISDNGRKDFYRSIFIGEKKGVGKRLGEMLIDNIWIKHFFHTQTYIKENWIDFESEISKIIILLEKAKADYDKKVLLATDVILPTKIIAAFCQEMMDENYILEDISDAFFKNIKSKLVKDLNRMITALEIYLAEYIGEMIIDSYNKSIAKLNPTHIISFNYTDTYKRVYDNGCRHIIYDYIHGKSQKANKESDLVLGIDEYLDDNSRSTNVEYIEFQKYYQRMQKRTDCSYKDWVDKITEECVRASNEKVALYIFGHSLDVTDKDILREFILNEHVVTTIFFYNQESYEREIANLVKVLGPTQLAKRMYGKDKSITFVKQESSCRIENSEFEISNDIIRLYNLGKYSDLEINHLLYKLDKKLHNKDKKYFLSQEKIISIFDALCSWKLCDDKLERELFEMAKLLSDPDNCIVHDIENWHKFSYMGDEGCDNTTLKFIRKINLYNEENVNINNPKNTKWIIKENSLRYDLEEDSFSAIIDYVLDQVPDLKTKNLNEWKMLEQIVYNNMLVAEKIIREKILAEEDNVKIVRLVELLSDCEEYKYYNMNLL